MASEYNDVMSTIGSNVQEDAESNTMADWIDKTLLTGVQDELKSSYGISLEYSEIMDYMEHYGIDFGFNGDYSVADLIFESMED